MDQKGLKAKLFIEGSTGNTGAANRAKGGGQKGNSKGKLRGYFGKRNRVSGRGESRGIVTDGIIHTKCLLHETPEQHIAQHQKYVHEVFDILKENDLFVKPEKCVFKQEETDYLGVIVGKGRLRMDPKKLQGMADYPVLKNVTDIRAFLGFMGYYCYFIENYLAIVRPLLDLTKKASIFRWEKCHQEAFDKIKSIMCKAPVLLQPDFNKKFYLQTDASAYGMGVTIHPHFSLPLQLSPSPRQRHQH